MTRTTPYPLLTRIAFVFLWLFVFTLPLAQATEIPGVTIFSQVAGLLATVAGSIAIVASRRIRLPGGVHMAMAGFILWSAVTLFWSVAPQLTIERITSYIQLFVIVLLIWELCREEKDVLRILSAFVLGTIVPALSTLNGFLPGRQTLIQRASSAGFDANHLAFLLALSLPVAYYLILRDKSPISALYRLQMGIAVCATLLTGSGAAMIAMAVGLSLVCWTIHVVPLRSRANAFAMVMLLGAAAIVLLPANLWQHIQQETRNGGISATAVVNNGLDAIRSTPIGGLGAGATAVKATPGSAIKRTSFTMFSETGVVGVGCFLAMLGILFLSAESMSGATKSFWFTVLAVWSVGVCALTSDCSAPAWLLFGLLAAHAACLQQEGVTEVERARKRNYYVEQSAEVWS